ncbi:MAG: DEAD/DEAH box helicase family protein [Phycisphaeraceae bacterium]|nr:DEAD/DEAH box helicase family protein [Phycisphaeraceae bacterium]
MANEADTCREYILPKLVQAGWDIDPHSITEQRTFTDGRIIVTGKTVRRGRRKRVDYLLRYNRDFPLAVVEAKADYKTPGAGLGQAKDYAQILGLKFAYSTNGQGIVEFDFTRGTERDLDSFPTPAALWRRYQQADGLADEQADKLLTPFHPLPGRTPRYYQDVAINRVVQAVVQGKQRILVTMATGTGKTVTAFQICWKLWNSRWNRRGEPHRRPKILYLADRNILIDDPKDKTFSPFGDARYKIENGRIVKSREMYFAIYQAIARDERRPGLYQEFDPDFFDLVIVDECHRGSARADSSWREILEYFQPAVQFGMTATPLRDDNRDTYRYFGNPIYTYSLRQGIEDGFLAPYRVHRIITTADAAGWRPTEGELDRFGREIPDEEYHTKDFEKIVALRARTQAIARHLTDYLKRTDRFAKTIVFCVDQEHAEEMRKLLTNLNSDLARQYPSYVCRVTADEGNVGRSHLSDFQDVETDTPVILTTSQLLTTGVDAPMVKNIVLTRVVGSISEFKQIIGRGTRVFQDNGKLYFTILDYTGSATSHFADPEFDGDPTLLTETTIDDQGDIVDEQVIEDDKAQVDDRCDDEEAGDDQAIIDGDGRVIDPPEPGRRKFYVDGGSIEIAHQVVYELDAGGKQLRVIQYTDYTAEMVRSLFPTPDELRDAWCLPDDRQAVIEKLAERGVDFDHLAEQVAPGNREADPFDLLCHVAFNAPLRTRRERAERLRKNKQDLFDQYGPEAKAILNDLLDKYAEHGIEQFKIPDALKVPPISERGNVGEIIASFGGGERLRSAILSLQQSLYKGDPEAR